MMLPMKGGDIMGRAKIECTGNDARLIDESGKILHSCTFWPEYSKSVDEMERILEFWAIENGYEIVFEI
jgi:hypothetical protein